MNDRGIDGAVKHMQIKLTTIMHTTSPNPSTCDLIWEVLIRDFLDKIISIYPAKLCFLHWSTLLGMLSSNRHVIACKFIM